MDTLSFFTPIPSAKHVDSRDSFLYPPALSIKLLPYIFAQTKLEPAMRSKLLITALTLNPCFHTNQS